MNLLKIVILILLIFGCISNEKKNIAKQKYDEKILNALKYLEKGDYRTAIGKFKSILSSIPSKDTIASFYYYKIGYCYEKQQVLDSAEIYYKQALKTLLLKKNHFSNELANCYNSIAYIFFSKYSDIYTAKIYYDSVLYISSRCTDLDSSYYAWNLFNIGYFYHFTGIYQKAEEYYSKAYNIFLHTKNNKYDLMNVSYYQAYINGYLKKFDIAHAKINEAINYFSKNFGPVKLKDLYIEKAHLYFLSGEYQKAINFYKKSLFINEKYNLVNQEKIFNRLAWCYSNLNKIDSSEYYFKKCFALINNKTDINIVVSLYGEYSRMLIKTGKYNTALNTIESRISYVKRILGEKNSNYGYFLYWKALAYDSL